MSQTVYVFVTQILLTFLYQVSNGFQLKAMSCYWLFMKTQRILCDIHRRSPNVYGNVKTVIAMCRGELTALNNGNKSWR